VGAPRGSAQEIPVTKVAEWFEDLDWVAIGEIILIDVLLGGDNALLIALACRNLPAHHRRLGILWGTAGAIILRVILITVAVALLDIPLLKLIGGLMLLWIGIKLIAPPPDAGGHGEIRASDKLWVAIKTIIVADFVMSLDNVIAIAGAAEQADPSQRTGLIIFGLLVSVPFIVFGSQLILNLLDRFPVIVMLGGALLGWIAGGLIIGDSILEGLVPQTTATRYAVSAATAVMVVVFAKVLQARRAGRSA
jgi:YjbE family integral membrane protein